MKLNLLLVLASLACAAHCEETFITIELVDDAIAHELSRDTSKPITEAQIPEYVADLQHPSTRTQVALIRAGKRAVPALRRAMDDADSNVREAILEIFEHMGAIAGDAVPELLGALRDSHQDVRYKASKAIAKVGTPVIPALLKELPNAKVLEIGESRGPELSQDKIIELFGDMGASAVDVVPKLFEILESCGEMKDGDARCNLREEIKEALRKICQNAPQISPLLKSKLNAPLLSVRYAAALTLVHMRQEIDTALPVLFEVMHNRSLKFIAWGNVLHLIEYSPQDLPQLAEIGFKDPDEWVRRTVVGAYLRGADHQRGASAIPQIIGMLNDPDSSVKNAAVRTLGDYKELAKDAVEPLRKMLNSQVESFLRISLIQSFANLGKFAPGIEDDILQIMKGTHFEPTKIPTDLANMKIPDQSGHDDTTAVRKACVETLLALKPKGPRKLNALLKDPDVNARRIGAWAMGELKHKGAAALPDLQQLLKDPEPSVQRAALDSIKEIDPALHQKLSAEFSKAKAEPAAAKPPRPPKADNF